MIPDSETTAADAITFVPVVSLAAFLASVTTHKHSCDTAKPLRKFLNIPQFDQPLPRDEKRFLDKVFAFMVIACHTEGYAADQPLVLPNDATKSLTVSVKTLGDEFAERLL